MKYYYGNSYKEAISNPPIEITNTNILQAYQDNYDCVIPASEVDTDWDEQYYQLVYKCIDDDYEYCDEYDDYDECRDVFDHMVEEGGYEYIVMQEISVYGNDEEIEIINEYQAE